MGDSEFIVLSIKICLTYLYLQEMEDRHVTLVELSSGVFYSAVFDGHGGAKTAEFAQNNLHNIIRESQFFKKGDFARACVEVLGLNENNLV